MIQTMLNVYLNKMLIIYMQPQFCTKFITIQLYYDIIFIMKGCGYANLNLSLNKRVTAGNAQNIPRRYPLKELLIHLNMFRAGVETRPY